MGRILSSWKEIAQYLGKGVRTVQRWERSGLPVRRPMGEPHAVIAHTDDIDAWLSTGGYTTYAQLQARVSELEAEIARLKTQAPPPAANANPSHQDGDYELLIRCQLLLNRSAAIQRSFAKTLELAKNLRVSPALSKDDSKAWRMQRN